MIYNLIKLSSPGWEFISIHEKLIEDQLAMWCCEDCKAEARSQPPEDGAFLDLLLRTSCGSEFMLEEEEDALS